MFALKQKTVKLRHQIVKLVAPNLYNDIYIMESIITSIPRPMTLFLRRRFRDKALIGVEIGVAEARNAENILKLLNVAKLFLVDPYTVYFQDDTKIMQFIDKEDFAHKRLAPFQDKIVWIKKNSSNAHKEIPNNLDFVYIDGNHSYDFIKKDIEDYYPKVKVGGVLGGHDFKIRCPVRKAVVEFTVENNLVLHVENADWFIVKP